MIQFPQIDLGSVLSIAGLAAIAIACAAALLLHGLLHSRIALLIAVVIGIVVAGPTLANALTNIVWALVPLGMVLIAGVVVVLWLLHRNPELLALARDVVPSKPQQAAPPPLELPAPPSAVVINQKPQTATPKRTHQTVVLNDGDRWGF